MTIHQLRYYGNGDTRNTKMNKSNFQTQEGLRTGNAFAYPIVKLTVLYHQGEQLADDDYRALKVYINGHYEPIIVGDKFEIDLTGMPTISSLRFNKQGLDMIDADESSYLIINYVTEDNK